MRDNPYAFPNDNPLGQEGMTLRDWFAGNAPNMPEGFSQNTQPAWPKERRWNDEYNETIFIPSQRQWEIDRRAKWAWAYADAMLAERAIRKTGDGE